VQAATSSTSTIMCVDAMLTEHAHWISDVARARSARVIETHGDQAIVAFESASGAVAAAVEMQQAVVGSRLLRIGLATGDVGWIDGSCTGAPVGIAAELFARAQPGQVLVSNVVRWLAASATTGSYVRVGLIEVAGLERSAIATARSVVLLPMLDEVRVPPLLSRRRILGEPQE